MTDEKNLLEVIDMVDQHRKRASDLEDVAEQKAEEVVSEVYGFDSDSVEAQWAFEDTFAVTIDDSELRSTLESRLDNNFRVSSTLKIMLESTESNLSDEQVGQLKRIISTLAEHNEEGAPIEDVLDEAERKLNVSEEIVELEIELLRRQGDVYEPRTNHLRTV